MAKKHIWITNNDDFNDQFIIDSDEWKRVKNELYNKKLEVQNGIISVAYDEYGGDVQFEIKTLSDKWIYIEFIGTAK